MYVLGTASVLTDDAIAQYGAEAEAPAEEMRTAPALRTSM
jgi:hypothetical protein